MSNFGKALLQLGASSDENLDDGDVIATGQRMVLRAQRRPRHRSVVLGAGLRDRIGAALDQPLDDPRMAHPGGVMQQRPRRAAADVPEEIRSECVDNTLELAAQSAEDDHLLAIGVQPLGQQTIRSLAAREGCDRAIPDREFGRCAELGQQRDDVRTPTQDSIGIRRAVLAGRCRPFAAAPVERCTTLGEQPDHLQAAATAYGVHQQRALFSVHPGIEQHSNMINMVIINGMRERIRPARLRPVVEKQLEAGGVWASTEWYSASPK
jgi:hypothetical protein